jgi:predicted pyridoxine 5'-phosphate oxidase superfamily flavin-nucleotide-binding protein
MPFASDVAFTESVKRVQRERGTRKSYERLESQRGGFASSITPEVAAYIEARTSAYLATANAAGQPYVQHRGGRAGFIKVLDPQTLAFADFAGNGQYITTGNLAENDQAFLFLMNYAEGERIKLWGRARIVSKDDDLLSRLSDPSYKARIEQAIVFDVSAWDANCSQHIPQLIAAEPVRQAIERMQHRITYLEAMLRDASIGFAPGDANN